MRKLKRAAAWLLTAAMLTTTVNSTVVLAESEVQMASLEEETAAVAAATEAPAPETQAPTEAPVPETQPPTEPPAPETQAPTEPPAPETQAPTEAPTPETQAPTEAATSAPETQPATDGAAQTEKGTEKASEKNTEKKTEKESETEKVKMTDTFKTTVDGVTFTLKLSGKEKLPKDTELQVRVRALNDGGKGEAAGKAVKRVVNTGHREMSGGVYYAVLLKQDGETIRPKNSVSLSVKYPSGKTLGLKPGYEPAAAVYAVTDGGASKLTDVSLQGNLNVSAFSVSGKGLYKLVLAGVSNHVNNGKLYSTADLAAALGCEDYAVIAGEVEAKGKELSQKKCPEQVLTDAADELDGLADLSRELANGRSSSQLLKIVNVYADSQGVISRKPLEQLSGSRYAVVNVVAASARQTLTLPEISWDESEEGAGRLIINVRAQGKEAGSTQAYTGELTAAKACGTILAGEATVHLQEGGYGQLYARKLLADKDTLKDMKPAPFSAAADEEETEGISENADDQMGEAGEAVEAESSEAGAGETAADGNGEAAGSEATEAVETEDGNTEGFDVVPEESETGKESIEEMDGEPETAGNDFLNRKWYIGLAAAAVETEDATELLPAEADAYALEWTPKLVTAETDDDTVTWYPYEGTWNVVNGTMVSMPIDLTLREILDKTTEVVYDPAVSFDFTMSWRVTQKKADAEHLAAKQPQYGTMQFYRTPGTGEEGVQTTPGVFRFINPKIETQMTVSVSASRVDNLMTFLSGTYQLKDEQGNVLKDAAGQALEITTPVTGAATLTLDGKSADLQKLITAAREAALKKATDEAETESDGNKKEPVLPESVSFPLYLTQLKAPGGYTLTNPQLFSQKLTVTAPMKEGEGHISIQGPTDAAPSQACAVSWLYKKNLPVVKIRAIEGGKTICLPGAEFVIKDSDGKIVKTNDPEKPVELRYTSASVETSVALDPGRIDALKDLKVGEELTWTIEELKTPTSYFLTGPAQVELQITRAANGDLVLSCGNVTSDEQMLVSFVHSGVGSGVIYDSIKAVKRCDFNGSIYPSGMDVNFYAALFDKDGRRISAVQTITIKSAKASGSTTFRYLQAGKTYYLKETDSLGNPVPEKEVLGSPFDYYVTFDKSTKVKVEGIKATSHTITMTNHYYEMPKSGFKAYKPFVVKKAVIDSEGNEVKDSKTAFYFAVFNKKTGKQIGELQKLSPVKNTSTGEIYYKPVNLGISLTSKTTETTLVIKECYSDGKVFEGNSKYEAPSYKNKELKISTSDDSTDTPTCTITNQLKPVEETEDLSKLQAKLKLTKKVTYKGAPMRVNAVYYIGIFDSPDMRPEKLKYKKALTLRNESEKTAELTINLYKLASKSKTFYFAEVNAKGEVVESGKKSGYNISQNVTKITLDAKNTEDELIVTNDIMTGTKREDQLTDPTGGFAGDSGAVAEAQDLKENGNSSAGTSTGDDTPIRRYVLWLTLSGVVLLGGVVLTKRRRRRG